MAGRAEPFMATVGRGSAKTPIGLIVDQQEMSRYISLAVDRSRRFGRTFIVIVIAPDLKLLSKNGVGTPSISELNALRPRAVGCHNCVIEVQLLA